MALKSKIILVLVLFLSFFSLWTFEFLMPSLSASSRVYKVLGNIKEVRQNSAINISPVKNSVTEIPSKTVIQTQQVQTEASKEVTQVEVTQAVAQPTEFSTTTNPPVNTTADTLNPYQRSLLEKEKKREEFLKRYIEEQREMALYPSSTPKFVIIYPLTSGIGNNLAILAEGILMSALTRRRLMIYDWPSFNQYFTLPMENYTLITNNFTTLGALNSGLQCRIPPKKFLTAPNRNIILRTFCKFTETIIKSSEYYDFLNDNGFVINPQLKSYQDIRKMVNYFFYSRVIQLLPDIREMIDEEKARLEWDKHYWIGIQVRSGKMPGDEGHSVFMYKDDIEMFIKHAVERTEKALSKQNKPVKWFVAADAVVMKELLLSRYPQYYVSTECTMSHSFRDVKRSDRTEGMLCTLLDNYVLSDVNEAVVTGASTYGLLATYRNLYMKKAIVNRGDWRKYQKTLNKN